ncbi:Hpt domain-containing protein [Pseudodesulfovibrio piezophilus]|uniref:Putative CheA signal transduction histidine kinase n=1 Tax=Pseudodesulfovibrio piezophilus (strain DSM 21447 / JCM 15486 / C1TLV30) TaxID=1322246 RepID=M1WUB4_PSEP2|nr:Hpt domain-containing protein [Pseudodesulfovibrio piezophilus]CCH50492.1 putative CheA signal transduction histidine kinase [Pseudodesulfovibrio piezophilus C1TLV30]
MSDDPMVEEFFSEVNDKYYPQVMEGLEMLEGSNISEGIEILARPLHTIKGVTGFMAGFEPASHFTHKIEDFLKKVQAGEVVSSPENVTLLSRGVNMIFQVLEQLRDNDVDEEEQEEVLGLITAASSSGQTETETVGAGVSVEIQEDVTIVHVKDPRVHLELQYKPILSAIMGVEPGDRILLDLSEVLTFGSTAWGAVASMGTTFKIATCCLTADAKQTLYGWGFDSTIAVYPDRDTYFTTQ